MNPILSSLSRFVLPAMLVLVSLLGACKSVPKGEGTYLITVMNAETGKPVDGVEIVAPLAIDLADPGVLRSADHR